jgi:hypothetical protein
MSKGFKKLHDKDRPALTALMRASKSAACLWFFMLSRAEWEGGKYIFCLAEDFIIADTGLSKNVVRESKRLLQKFFWIIKVGMRGSHGHWDTTEYEVHLTGKAPTGAQKVCPGKEQSTGAQKVCSRPEPGNGAAPLDTHSPIPPRGGDGLVAPSHAGGCGGSPPTGLGLERSDSSSTKSNGQGDAMPLGASRPSSFLVRVDQNRGSKSKPHSNPMGGCAPQTPCCGDMGVSEPEEMSDAHYLALLLWYYIQGRLSLGEKKIVVLPRWEEYWTTDFQGLLDSGATRADIELAIWASQWPAKKLYYKRSQSICAQYEQLLDAAQKLEKLFALRQCPGCYCYFSLASQFNEHIPVCAAGTAAVLPAPDDATEEDAYFAAEDVHAMDGIVFSDPDPDPYADSRLQELADDDGGTVFEEMAPGQIRPVMLPEDWGQHDFDFKMPEPFKTKAKGRIRPEGEKEDKRDWVRPVT